MFAFQSMLIDHESRSNIRIEDQRTSLILFVISYRSIVDYLLIKSVTILEIDVGMTFSIVQKENRSFMIVCWPKRRKKNSRLCLFVLPT